MPIEILIKQAVSNLMDSLFFILENDIMRNYKYLVQ